VPLVSLHGAVVAIIVVVVACWIAYFMPSGPIN